MNELELAWAAGFFDGEGTIYYPERKDKTHTGVTIISVSQSGADGRALLKRFWRAVGRVGNVTGPYGPYQDNRQPYWRWQAAVRADVESVIRVLTPYLGPAKKRQIKRVLGERRKRGF